MIEEPWVFGVSPCEFYHITIIIMNIMLLFCMIIIIILTIELVVEC